MKLIDFTSNILLNILPNAIPSKIPWISKIKYKGNEIIKISVIRKIEFFRNLLYLFSPRRLCWYKKKNENAKHRKAAYWFMKSKIIVATHAKITASKFTWSDKGFFSLAIKTTTVWGRPNRDTTEKVPASAIRYPNFPKSVGSKMVAKIRKKIANNADAIILPSAT